MALTKSTNRMTSGASINVLDFGAVGDGVTDDRAALASATAAGNVVVTAGTYKISSNITISNAIAFEQGAKLSIDTGVTVTFSADVEASFHQIFSGLGAVVFTHVTECYPEWWGATGDGTTDDYAAIQAAVNSYPTGGGKIKFRLKTYIVSDTVAITKSFIMLEGSIPHVRQVTLPTLVSSHATKPALSVIGGSAGGHYDGNLENTILRDMYFSRTAAGAVGSKTIVLTNCLFVKCTNIGFSHSAIGMYVTNINGLYMMAVNASIGIDIAADLYGLYVDGSVQGSTGILLDGFLFYGGTEPSRTSSTAYYDLATAVGSGMGDRRLHNIEITGETDNGIWLQNAADGFASDVQIRQFSMDAIQEAGITILATTNQVWEQANIVSGWINLINSSGTAKAIQGSASSNINIHNVTLANTGTGTSTNEGVRLTNCDYAILDGLQFTGTTSFTKSIYVLSGSDFLAISACIIKGPGPVHFAGMSSSVISALNAVSTTVTFDAGSNYNRYYGSLHTTLTDNGTGNVTS